jgi:hypothetical protein
MYTVRITNDYSDGHTSTHEARVAAPAIDWKGWGGGTPPEIDWESWWQEVVWPETGDGHGAAYPELGCCYTAEIIAADEADHLGKTYEWA